MFRKLSLCGVLTLVVCASAQIEHHPKNAGGTQARNVSGSSSEGQYFNPALLGVERSPKGAALLGPIGDFGAGYWSDKLALRPYRGWFSGDERSYAAVVGRMLFESIRADATSNEDENARLIAERVKGGTSLYFGSRASLLSFAYGHLGFDMNTHVDIETRLPEGMMQVIFPYGTNGLTEGASLDFSDMKMEAVWATDLSVSLGLPLSIPALHDIFKLRYAAGGVGVKYVLGHGIFRQTTDNATLDFTSSGLKLDADVTLQQAGLGLHGAWLFTNPFDNGFSLPVNGHGIGVSAGGILYDDKASLSINIDDLGVIFWVNDVKDVNYRIRGQDLDLEDVFYANDNKSDQDNDGDVDDDDWLLTLFNQKTDKVPVSSDSLEEANGFVSFLPLTLNVGYSYTWSYERHVNQKLRFVADYITAGANYRQHFTPGPGRSFIPRLSMGGEFGMVRSFVPLRLGLVLGGSERIASSFGAGFNFRYVSLNAAYKAIGTPVLIPKRGMELAAGLNVNWGMVIDSDKDGIIDRDDKCPFKAEDRDGFEDEDGCPEEDNDHDGIVDLQDKCPNVAEDGDAYEDGDGCPEYDNDADGVADTLDKCPLVVEDRDNFEDGDGCPEFDNDKDGVPDSTDRCPITAEDTDSFEDEDGCPDYDNDKDGIADTLDRCPLQAEVYNGFEDNDGCPDTLKKPTPKEEKELVTKLSSINFKSNSAELTANSFTSLNFIVTFLMQYPHLRYEVQGHTDSQGEDEYNLLLSAARASTVRSYLVHQGVPANRIIAIGYGEQRPVADNALAEGRAQNRRVQFKIIETVDEYEMLKRQEEIFEARIREANISGSGKRF